MAQEATEQAGQEPAATTEPDEGQEPQPPAKGETFDKAYVQSLRAEAARYRKEAHEAKAQVQEHEDRDKTELEKLTGKVTKAERERDDAKANLLRFEVAAEKQVPADALDLLVGNTREELEARADRILELTVKSGATARIRRRRARPGPRAERPAGGAQRLADGAVRPSHRNQ